MSDHGRWCNHAFGLALDSSFPLVGFAAETGPPPVPLAPVRLTLVPGKALREAFASGSEPIAWRRQPHHRPGAPDVLSHPRAGFLLRAPAGQFQVSPGGDEVRCAPRQEPGWKWQRFLLGRVLPFAATLNGLEPWHASAVADEAGVIALLGAAGTGKSTIAARLILAGAQLMADDVISVELAGDAPLVHPGPPLMSLHADSLPPAAFDTLGPAIGRQHDWLRLAVRRAPEPLPLRAAYVLGRQPEPSGQLEPPSAGTLIGGTFNFAIRTPERLRHQLAVASAIAHHARPVRIGIQSTAGPSAVAEQIRNDFRHRLAGRIGRG